MVADVVEPPLAQAPGEAPEVLTARGVCAGYGDIPVLEDVSLTVKGGQCVAVIGANGAGKTTLLRTLSGQLRLRSGEITFCGEPMRREQPHVRARRGLAHLPEGRGVFRSLSVWDNLRLYGATEAHLPEIGEHFPVLTERLRQPAALLSGGEQQMLALAVSLIRRPRLLMVDELSFGLAPAITSRLGAFLRGLRDGGRAILLVEESLSLVATVADHVYVMQTGRIVYSASSEEIRADSERITKAYLATD